MEERLDLIIGSMICNGYSYKDHMEKINLFDKKSNFFDISEHIKYIIFAQLSNQREWSQIQKKYDKIVEIFDNFNSETLKGVNPKTLVSKLRNIKCGNISLNKQMTCLKENILTLEKIELKYGDIFSYYNSCNIAEIIKELSSGPNYKIKQMGVALVCEYLKNIGYDISKPDSHVIRLLHRLGYIDNVNTNPYEIINIMQNIAKANNIPAIELDSIFWQFCASGYAQICTSNPNCDKCLLLSKCGYYIKKIEKVI